MKVSSVFDILICAVLIVLALIFSDHFSAPYLVSPLSTPKWSLLIHGGYNIVFWWPEWQYLKSVPNLPLYCALGIIGLTPMIAAKLPRQSGLTLAASLARSISLPLLFIVLFGADAPLFEIIAQTGSVLIACLLLLNRESETLLHALMLGALGITANALFENQFSPYCMALIAFSFFSRIPTEAKSSRGSLIAVTCASTLILIFAVTQLYARPSIPEFGYPGTARVVADDGIPGNITPLIGESTIITFLDRLTIRGIFRDPAIVFALLIGYSLFQRRHQRTPLWWALATLLSLLYWDSSLPETLSTLGPIESARRIAPGIFPFSLTPIAAGLCLTLFWGLQDAGLLRAALLVGLAPLCIFLPVGRLSGIEASAIDSTILAAGSLAASPSFSLLRHENLSTIEIAAGKRALQSKSVSDLDGSLFASHRSKEKLRKLLSDGRTDTRWSPKRGAQYGDEWIEIHFPHATDLYGIEALPGKFFSDFPRGISVDLCDSADMKRMKKLTPVIRIPHWQGGIEMSPEGFPYYTGQHDVKVYFPGVVRTQCLRLSQISESPNFDWSVAELRLLSAAEKAK